MLAAVLDVGAEEVNDLGDVVRDRRGGRLTFMRVRAGGDRRRHAAPVRRHRLDADRVRAGRGRGARKVLRIVDAREDLDDVQNVWFNADIADEVMELVEA